MQSQQSSSSSTSRASADVQKKSGIGYPAVQRFKQSALGSKFRESNNGNLIVEGTGAATVFYAKDPAVLAHNAIVDSGEGPQGMRKYNAEPTIAFAANCYEYANNVIRHMQSLSKHDPLKRVTNNLNPQEEVPESSFQGFFNKNANAIGNAAPQLGEVYFAISDWTDQDVINKTIYNMHWATVVAIDGADVITIESSPSATHPYFQMYSQVNQSQTFRQHYISAGLLKQNVKVYALTVSKGETKQTFYDDVLE